MAIEFSERLRRIPVYPAADAYAVPDDVAMMASNESPDPPLPAVLEAITRELTVATRLVIVCNPNNPTSTAVPLDDIAAFVADVPRHVAVILDEAYCEFNVLDDPDASLDLLARHPNLVLLRTFSKI